MLTLHKAEDCKLENYQKDADEKGLQIKDALATIEQDEESVR